MRRYSIGCEWTLDDPRCSVYSLPVLQVSTSSTSTNGIVQASSDKAAVLKVRHGNPLTLDPPLELDMCIHADAPLITLTARLLVDPGTGYQYAGTAVCQIPPSLLCRETEFDIPLLERTTFSANSNDPSDFIRIGTVQIHGRTTSPSLDPVESTNLAIYDQTRSQMENRLKARLYEINQMSTPEHDLFTGSHEKVKVIYEGIPIGIRDSWQARPESCRSNKEAIDNLLQIGKVIAKCENFIELSKRDPDSALLTVVVAACRAAGNTPMYTDDLNAIGDLTDEYTNVVGVCHSLHAAGLRGALIRADCEDAANFQHKCWSVLVHGSGLSDEARAAAAVMEKYCCVNVFCIASSGSMHTSDACAPQDRRGHWSKSTSEQVKEEARKHDWANSSYCHSTNLIMSMDTFEFMLKQYPGPPVSKCITMEGTSWATSEPTETTCDQRARERTRVTEAVTVMSQNRTRVACPRQVGDVDFYRSVSHLTGPDGRAYYTEYGNKRCPHYYRLLDDPGSVKLTPAAPDFTPEEVEYMHTKMPQQSPDFPFWYSGNNGTTVYSTREQLDDFMRSPRKVRGVLRGAVTEAEVERTKGPSPTVLCLPLIDGLDVRLYVD